MQKHLNPVITTFSLLLVLATNPFIGANGAYARESRPATADSEIVDFNTSNHKFHAQSCIWAKRCTVNCIKITRAEAHQRGGIPCKVCGGGEY